MLNIKSLSLILASILYITACSFPAYISKDQLNLHEKLSQKKMKVAVLPFTLNTPNDVDNVAFNDVDVSLTNEFTKIIWKKNKVKIAKKEDILKSIQDNDLKYSELNPDMEDLKSKPNMDKLIKVGEELGVNVVFVGTVRTNKYDYEGGCCVLIPSFMASRRVYNIGAQMMAIDIDKKTALAFDYINNKLAVPTKFFSLTGSVDDEDLTEGKAKLLEKCGFALAYYAPKPEIRTDASAIALQTGAALLNIFAGTEFTVDTSIKDETWKMYPPDFFNNNFGYTKQEFEMIPKT